MTMLKRSEETTRQTRANMQLMENKPKTKRKGEKRDLCCAWECSDTDGGINDNAFHQYQETKQKIRHKCSYLDERNIILSPHFFAQPRSCVSGANDASDEANSRWKASQISSVPTKSASPDVNITTERPSAPDPSCVPINPSVSTDSMTQRQNTVSENSLQVHIVEVNGILPMTEWIPESSHEQMTEETTSWRCAGLVSANNETRSPEALWKKASGKKIEWCHERLAKAAHLGSSSPTAARPRVVIRRLARGRGYRGTSRHREQKLKPLVNHKDLHNSYYSLSTLQNCYGCLCSPCQPRLRHSPGGDQRDATQNLDRKQQTEGQQREFSEATGDIRCQSGSPKNAESPPTPHHVTFSHILQVLQTKPTNFPAVRGQRCHRAL
ncbi:uncharacterized protein LOC107657738 [Sinocyclocheilus anshuiensis]|uniref:uncharacterized protein LOC107657738 n=1 Tax=Sinocyclocheilus anshuiensis TaxID=1608454 RepID=UPI0007BA5016|nr:PREDICTED: uncharacterized protein LOC107657738 [Sinocyclocheilus anshuiensis]